MNNLNNEGVRNIENDVLYIDQPNTPASGFGIRSKDIKKISREFLPSFISVNFILAYHSLFF